MGKALLILCAAALLTGALAMSTTNRTVLGSDQTVSFAEGEIVARQNAQSALNQATAAVRGSFANALTVGVLGKKNGTGGGTLWSTVVADATRPGAFVVKGFGQYVGTINGRLDTTTVEVQQTLIMVSPLDAAVIVESPAASVSLVGGNFLVDGQNTTPPSSSVAADPTLSKRGIKTSNASVASLIGTTLGTSRLARVRGLQPSGDISSGDVVSGNFQAAIQAIFDEARLYSSRTNLTNSNLSSGTYGSAASPAVVVREGDLNVSGTVTGYGILVVNGNLTIAGNFRWEGVVIAKRESSNLSVSYGGNADIYGSLVLLQGSSAFTMPVNGRIKVRYVSSDAGLKSSVWIHPYGADPDRYYAPGSNGCSAEPYEDHDTEYQRGQQMNFFIGVHRVVDAKRSDRCTDDVLSSEYYRHYARGHYAQNSGKPYGFVKQTEAYLFTVAFEDIDEVINSGFGTTPDWDYDDEGKEDQKIEVEIQCRNRNAQGNVTSGWHKCLPTDPEANAPDQLWSGGVSGAVASATTLAGSTLGLTVRDYAEVRYSTEAIARLASKLTTIRDMAQIVVVDQRTVATR